MKTLLLTAILFATALPAHPVPLPALNRSFGEAHVRTAGDTLTVTTGPVTQQWRLTPRGLATVSLTDNSCGREWCTPGNDVPDWAIYGLTEGRAARLVSLEAEVDDDEGFTRKHLRITSLFEYAAVNTCVRYEIRAYPGAGGIYTRLAAKGDAAAHLRRGTVVHDDRVILEQDSDKAKMTGSAFSPPQPEWFNNVVCAPETVDIRVSGLRPGREYKATFTFWNNVCDERIEQQIRFACAGRTIVLAPCVTVQPFGTTGCGPETLTVDIPAEAVTASEATITLHGTNGGKVLASEVWISERSEEPAVGDLLFAAPARKEQVLAAVAKGYRLVGYNDLGTKTGMTPQAPNGYVARLPVAASDAARHYAGYYTDTQNRNTRDTPLLWEESHAGPVDGIERSTLASLVAVERENEGLLLLKESHKCVNQYGVDTGNFTLDSVSVANTGMGFAPEEIPSETFVEGWANWTILYGDGDRALALKKFDRMRFPVRRMVVMSNTWGSDNRNSRYAAREGNVLREIESARNLGIEVVQVDDGWQGITYEHWHPAPSATLGHTGRYDLYPDGWTTIREAARRAGVLLGLWFAWYAPEREILWNSDAGGFVSFKLDFSKLDTKAKLDGLMQKARTLLLHTDHRASVNWDLTEIAPRVGIYYGREYGNVYLENRKPEAPARIVYVPYLVLRDAWHLSHYANLNQYQISIQHLASVSRTLSNAHRYGQGYATAIALMGSPLFFCETQHIEASARQEVRNLLAVYKGERARMTEGFVSPVGDEPNDAHWTGFRNAVPGSDTGYLLLFREADNPQREKRILLEGCAGRRLRLNDLMTGERFERIADEHGAVPFTIEKPADFRFYTYKIL